MQKKPSILIVSYITSRIMTILFHVQEGYLYALLVTFIIFLLPENAHLKVQNMIKRKPQETPVESSTNETTIETTNTHQEPPQNHESPIQTPITQNKPIQSLKIKWLKNQKKVIPKPLTPDAFGEPLLSTSYDFHENFNEPFIIIDDGEETFIVLPEKTKENILACFRSTSPLKQKIKYPEDELEETENIVKDKILSSQSD